MDLWATYTRDWELQALTALSLIHTFYKSLEHFTFVYISRSLVTDLNSEDSSSSVLRSLLFFEYPATELNF
jgi:hypothetical protein